MHAMVKHSAAVVALGSVLLYAAFPGRAYGQDEKSVASGREQDPCTCIAVFPSPQKSQILKSGPGVIHSVIMNPNSEIWLFDAAETPDLEPGDKATEWRRAHLADCIATLVTGPDVQSPVSIQLDARFTKGLVAIQTKNVSMVRFR